MDYTIKIGGAAGQGIETISGILTRLLARAGYHVFSHQDYESRVRGGHNFFQIRFSDTPVMASRDRVDIVLALDKASITLHEKELSENGIIVYDAATLNEKHEGPRFLDVPFTDLAVRHGGNKIMANVVATGAVMGMLGLSRELLFAAIKDTFGKKGEEVTRANIEAARAGHEHAVAECLECSFTAIYQAPPKMLIAGSDAIGFGAVASGCKFYAAYPMTPSTGILTYVAGKAVEYGIVVEQAEDEVAAINMAIGASFGGVRAMTGSSGGGFSLMVEGLSLAGMTETPVVIALAQRPGPATGLPTRTEQADLFLALFAGHGEFPRVIFAPGSPEQAFFLTNKAFDLAEKYQIPAFVMTDQYLADAEWTYDGFDLSRLRYTDYRLRGDAVADPKGYKRYAYSANGVSPLAVPGLGSYLVVADSDEHDEEGHLVEDAETRVRMIEKRLFTKLPLIQAEMEPPFLYGAANPEIVVVGWGSTYGPIREVVDVLSRTKSIAMLHFSEVYPLPQTDKFDWLALLRGARRTICVENNALGKFVSLVRMETGYTFDRRINRYDGRPFTVETLVREIDGHIG